ncbi:MAG: MipA/OmpV family protein [Paucibacter sp.]|nr:MipA/OmpV family protein [Roseateles sp.]
MNTLRPLLLLIAVLLGSPAARADEDDFNYALGLQLANRPQYPGSSVRETRVSPVWALHWRRLRISTGGGSMLMGFGSTVYGPGASADLLTSGRLRVGISLRFDNGRKSSDSESTRNLPDVRRTLRGRLFASYALDEDLQWSASLSQDLLGRGGGLILGSELSKRLYRDERSEWSAGVGVTASDATQMRSYFGVRPEDVQASGLPAYAPGAGFRDVWAGVSYTRLIDHHWIMQATANGSRLLGPAADSPLTVRPAAASFTISLAYRR